MKGIDELPACSGIYAIDTLLGTYVGQGRNLRSRAKRHLVDLENGVHHNQRLQRIFSDQREGLLVKVLEQAPSSLSGKDLETWLDRREAFWMKRHGNALNIEPSRTKPFDHEEHVLNKHENEQDVKRLRNELRGLERELNRLETELKKIRARVGPEHEQLIAAYENAGRPRRFLARLAFFGSLPGAFVLGGHVLDTAGWSTLFLFTALFVAVYFHFSDSQKQKEILKKIDGFRQLERMKSREINNSRHKIKMTQTQLEAAEKVMRNLNEEERIFLGSHKVPRPIPCQGTNNRMDRVLG